MKRVYKTHILGRNDEEKLLIVFGFIRTHKFFLNNFLFFLSKIISCTSNKFFAQIFFGAGQIVKLI